MNGRKPRALLAVAVAGTLWAGAPVPQAPALSGEAKTMASLINEERVDREIRELKISRKVARYARRHSRKMAKRGEIFHTRNLSRVLSKRVQWRYGGENVGVGGDVTAVFDAFMDSRGHRRNILKKKFDFVAPGVVLRGGQAWVTVIFYGR